MDHIKPLGNQPVQNEFTSNNDDYLDIPTSTANVEHSAQSSQVINDNSSPPSSEPTNQSVSTPRYPRSVRRPPEHFDQSEFY